MTLFFPGGVVSSGGRRDGRGARRPPLHGDAAHGAAKVALSDATGAVDHAEESCEPAATSRADRAARVDALTRARKALVLWVDDVSVSFDGFKASRR